MKRKLPKQVRATLDAARSAAAMETCALDPQVKEAVRNYLNSWVVGRLDRIVKWDNGERKLR